MSPIFSSAGGLNARTRATRFSGSRKRTPGVAANTRPFRSYVPSPGSNSSATAISSPGRTIFGSIRSIDSFKSHGVEPSVFIPSPLQIGRGRRQSGGDPQDPVPASEVDRGPTVDIALRIGEVTNLGRDSGRRQILLRRRHRAGEPVERLQDSLKPDFLRRLTPSSGVLTPRPTPTCA